MRVNLADSRGLDAVVEAEATRSRTAVRYVDLDNRPARTVKILKGTIDEDLASLVERYGDLDTVSDALIANDPEVDLERVGAYLTDTSRVYVNAEGEVAHAITRQEVVHAPDGTELERRPVTHHDANVADTVPLQWTGRRIPRAEAVRRFVFSNALQLTHVNGLTYDFLFGMAADLAETDDLLLLGAGPEGKDPLVFRRKSRPYRGFLDGRVDGDAYLLLLHLSNLELKSLASA